MVLRDPIELSRPTVPVAHDLPRASSVRAAANGRLNGIVFARGTWLANAFVSCVVLAATLYAALGIASQLAQTSDSTQGLVEGYAIARGNVLLSGWHLPLDNYYFTDTLPYAALERIVGPQPFLLALVPALTYALFVCAGLALCLKPGQSLGQNVVAASAAALMLAPAGWIGRWNPLLMSDMHFATAVYALLALALCARIAECPSQSRAPGGRCVVFVLFVIATIASDPFSLVFAFGPAFVLLSGDAVLRRPEPTERIALFALAVAVVVGLALPLLIAGAGGFATINNVETAIVSPALLGQNAVALVGGILKLAGVDPFGAHLSLRSIAFLASRALALTIAIFAVLHAARGLFVSDRASLFERFLCAGVLILLAACLLSTQFGRGVDARNPWGGGPPMRYAMPAVMFAAVLGARRIRAMLSVLRDERARILARGGLVLLAGLAFSASMLATRDEPRWIADNPPVRVARWLTQHGLTRGDADYWSANLLAAMSNETLDLRSVVPEDGRVVSYALSADMSVHSGPSRFVIWQDGTRSGMTLADVRATYRVCELIVVAGYRIALLAGAEGEHPCLGDPIDHGTKARSA